MEQIVQQVLNGLTVGSGYALVALGYTMVYGVLKFINFAHGDLFMLGTYVGLSVALVCLGGGLSNQWLVLLLVFVAAMSLVGLVGVSIERVAYRPLRRSGRLAPVVSALGCAVVLQNAVMLASGARYQVFPEGLVPSAAWRVAGMTVPLLRVSVLILSLIFMGLLYLFIHRTTVGAAIRATALDHDTARLMGINVDRIIMLVFLIGPALGAAAGIMIGLYYRQVYFTMGWSYGLKAFTAAVLGGIGNIPGAMVGGIILGLLETLGAAYISAAWKDAFAFLLLISILILRPTGLLGERVAEKL
ncbi:MAG: branched-chain amino acid ABC transporter permease [Bacillota bacterium]